MKKKTAALVLLLAALCMACSVQAEETYIFRFENIGDTIDEADENGVIGVDGDNYVVVWEKDGRYVRAVAALDEKVDMLRDAIENASDWEAIEEACLAYDEYLCSLPISYAEELAVSPLNRESLDNLAGKTVNDLEDAGYEYLSGPDETDEDDRLIVTMSYGMFDYEFEIDTAGAGYENYEKSGSYGDLVIRSACFSGLSFNATELRFHADGTVDEAEDLLPESGIVQDAAEIYEGDAVG